MKKVLLIAFDFPPRRTSGVYRPVALSKYLPQFGWQPIVLTVETKAELAEDRTLLQKVPPEVKVVRTRHLRLDGWEHRAAKAVQSVGGLQAATSNSRPQPFDRFLRFLGRLLRAFLYFPDQNAGWIPFGLTKAIQLHREQAYDIIYTTSPPRSGPVIGLLLKLLLRLPWVVEFRDPWLPPAEVRAFLGEPVPSWRRKLDCRLFKLLLRRTDKIITVTKGHADELNRQYGVPTDKLAVVSNGFDEDDFHPNGASAASPFPAGHVNLSHFGSVYAHFSGRFFAAVDELVCERPELKERLRINIIGFPDEDIRQYAREDGLKNVIQIRNFVGHDDALRAMRSSDCLLLFYAHRYISQACVPGKIYEYLRVGRPILAVTYEGGVKELIEEGDAGWIMPPDDVPAMKQTLSRLLDGDRNGVSFRAARPEFAAQFRHDRLASEVASVLNGIVDDDR
jgi:glycosyltransferase involved in cell wall biosynthesis